MHLKPYEALALYTLRPINPQNHEFRVSENKSRNLVDMNGKCLEILPVHIRQEDRFLCWLCGWGPGYWGSQAQVGFDRNAGVMLFDLQEPILKISSNQCRDF